MPTSPTKQSEHVAAKVRWLLSLEGNSPALLAVVCGVRSQSVYDWRDFGRVAKKHIPKLAEITGTTERWWLTPDAPIPPASEWMERPVAAGATRPAPPPSSATSPDASTLGQALPVVLGALRGLSAAERTEMASRWAALLLAPDSAELQRWLAQALGAQEWDGLTERRSGNDRRRPSDPLPLKQTPPRFAA
jgi:hypothetical protein